MIHTKSPTFAILTSLCSGDAENEVINGIVEQAKKNKWKILIFNSLDNYSTNQTDKIGHCIFQLADSRPLSGVFITENVMNVETISDGLVKQFTSQNIPVVSVGYKANDCNCVLYKEGDSFEKMVDHVIEEHGCKVLNLVAGTMNNVASQKRIDAFKHSLAKHNLKFDERRMFYGDFWRTPTEQGIEDFFKSGLPLPDAFICCNDEMAITVCEVLQKRNIKIPDDVIVTGYDGIVFAQLNSPQLSTVKCDADKLGIESVKLMKKIIKDKESSATKKKKPYVKILEPRMIFTESCGCKKFNSHNFNQYSYLANEQVTNYMIMNGIQLNMLTENANAKNISEIRDYLQTKQYFGSDCWIMLNHALSSVFYKKKYSVNNPFDPKMDCFFCSKNWRVYDFPSIKRTNYIPEIDELLETSFDCLVFTPITFGEEVMGYSAYPFFKSQTKLERIERFSQTLGQCLAYTKDHEQMQYIIDRDLLTGVYNRRGFFTELKSKIESAKSTPLYLAIHSIDMDNLKSINDTFGHGAGDFAIKSLSKAIISATSKNAITARFGGDEFVSAILTKNPPEDYDEVFKTKLYDYIANVNKKSGKPFFISASCGSQIAQISEFDEEIIDTLMTAADNSMYKDKKFRKRNKPRKSKISTKKKTE